MPVEQCDRELIDKLDYLEWLHVDGRPNPDALALAVAHREAAIAEDRRGRTFSPDELAEAEQRGEHKDDADHGGINAGPVGEACADAPDFFVGAIERQFGHFAFL